jgi:hypothetical protein
MELWRWQPCAGKFVGFLEGARDWVQLKAKRDHFSSIFSTVGVKEIRVKVCASRRIIFPTGFAIHTGTRVKNDVAEVYRRNFLK